MLTVDKAQFISWCDGILLSFSNGRGILVNECECADAAAALQRGEVVLLRNGAELTGTELVFSRGAYRERPSNAALTGGVAVPSNGVVGGIRQPGQKGNDMGLQDWTTDSDKFEPEDGGLTRLSFPCCACTHQRKTDADEPCRTCGHNVNAVIDTANAGAVPRRGSDVGTSPLLGIPNP